MPHTHTHTERARNPRPAEAQVAQVAVPATARPFLSFVRFELLTCRQAAVLLTVRANPGMTTGAIAGALDMSKAVVTRSVDKLEAFGLVRRVIDPADQRLRQVWPVASRKRRG